MEFCVTRCIINGIARSLRTKKLTLVFLHVDCHIMKPGEVRGTDEQLDLDDPNIIIINIQSRDARSKMEMPVYKVRVQLCPTFHMFTHKMSLMINFQSYMYIV